jgi:hypothetical protein
MHNARHIGETSRKPGNDGTVSSRLGGLGQLAENLRQVICVMSLHEGDTGSNWKPAQVSPQTRRSMVTMRTNTGAIVVLAIAMGVLAFSEVISAPTADVAIAPEIVSQLAARVIEESIPRQYERSKDWGRTKEITTGLRSSGNFFKFDIHRRKTAVNHGVWTKYRATLVEPEKHLAVRIENLRNLGGGRMALTLFVTAKVQGWARTKVYERGVHLISVEAEGTTSVRLWLDTEISIEPLPSHAFVPGVAIRPEVKDARLKLDDFQLKRISNLRGDLAREIGDGLRHVIEDELSGSKLAAKVNRSIEKRRDQLEFTPDKLLGVSASDAPSP